MSYGEIMGAPLQAFQQTLSMFYVPAERLNLLFPLFPTRASMCQPSAIDWLFHISVSIGLHVCGSLILRTSTT